MSAEPEDALRAGSFSILSRLQSGLESVVRLDEALAAVAAARAAERAKWMPAIALAQQCIAAAYDDRWPEFDRLSDDFDDACADAVLPMKPAAAIRDIKPEGE